MFDNTGLGGVGFGSSGLGGAPSRWLPQAPPVPRGQETGAGPDDMDPLRLDLVDGPTAYAASPTGAKLWQRHTSADERRRFDSAHVRLDDLGLWYEVKGGSGLAWGGARETQRPRDAEAARTAALLQARSVDLRCSNNDPCWQRFREERLRLELGRLYLGVALKLPFYLAAPGQPRLHGADPQAWRLLRRDGHFDEGHRFIDRNAPPGRLATAASEVYVNTAAEQVCGNRNEACQRTFSQERARLEYIRWVRAQGKPSDFLGFGLNARGSSVQMEDLLTPRPEPRPGKTIHLSDPTGSGASAGGAAPPAPAPPRFNPDLLRLDPSRLTPEAPAPPYITDRLRPLASTDAAAPDAPALPPEVQAELEMLRAQLAAVGVETTSLRELVELLRAQAVELEGEEPGLFTKLWAKVKAWWSDLFDGDDDAPGPPPTTPAALLPETSGASIPPEVLDSEAERGAGPDDEPQGFGSRLLAGAKDLALWGGIAVTVIILTGIIVAGLTARWTLPAAAGLGGQVLDTVGGLGGKALDNTGRAASALVPVLSKGG